MQLRIVDGVLMHEEQGEAFLLHSGTGRYFGLNKAGVTIWRAIERGEDPVAALGDRWPDVPARGPQRDTEALIEHLIAAELVVASG